MKNTVTRNKANRKLVSIDEKIRIKRLLESTSLTQAEAEERNRIISMLPKNCFVDGNKASINMDAVEKFFVTNENYSFCSELAKSWKHFVKQFNTPTDRYNAIKTLAVLTYHCSFDNETISTIAKLMGVEIEKANNDEPDEFLEAFAHAFSLDVVNTSLTYYKYRLNKMASTLLDNAVKNLNSIVKGSKSKKIKDMNLIFAHDDAKLCKYPDSNYRADFVVIYNEKGEQKRLFHEHFGWNGSDEYDSKISEKIMLAATNSIPLWYTISSNKNVDIVDRSKDLILSTCEQSVYDWTLSNMTKLDCTIDSLYIAIEYMLEYLGIEKLNATMSTLFKA